MFLIVMLTDSFAYVFGKLFKRWLPQKLAPKISPNKTIIGGAGGILGGMAAGVIAYWLWFGMSKDAVGAVVGHAGDLFESYLKRKCGIKDSGKILPGHGGVLDRFDSMFFVGVLVLISFLIIAI